MSGPDADMLKGLLAQYGKPTRKHTSGEDLLTVVFADPGTNGFYYRDKKPDSCAAYLRVDLLGAAIEILVAAQMEEAKEALRGLVALYEDDEGCAALPQVVAAKALLAKIGEAG